MSKITATAERILIDNLPNLVKELVNARRNQAEHRIKVALEDLKGYGFAVVECFNSKQMPIYVAVSFVAEKLAEKGMNVRKSYLRKRMLESYYTHFVLGVAAEQLNASMVEALKRHGFAVADYGRVIVVRKAPIDLKLRRISLAIAN